MCLPNAKHVLKVEREWEHFGLQCAVIQAREHSNRCGYVRIPPGHKYHGTDYNEIDVSVHGGLTYAEIEPCAHDDGTGWWVGFDCAHAGDASYEPRNPPEFMKKLIEQDPALWTHDWYEHFWTHEEVVWETEKLAEQLARI